MTDPLPVGLPIGHIGLSVPDIDAAVAWYTTVFGFTLLEGPITIDDDSPATETAREVYGVRWHAMRQAHLTTVNGVGLELFQFLEPAETAVDRRFRPWHPGLFHFCVVSHDVADLAQRIVANGGTQSTSIHRPTSDYAMCYCRDPWGNALEIYDRSYEQAHPRIAPTEDVDVVDRLPTSTEKASGQRAEP